MQLQFRFFRIIYSCSYSFFLPELILHNILWKGIFDTNRIGGSLSVCLSYWDIGIVYCTCGHFLRKRREENQKLSSTRWTSSQFPTASLRKDDLTDTDMVRRRETGNITSPTSSRRSARRRTSRVSMTGSYEMNNSAIEWLRMIETKMFVDKWMLLQMEIIPTIWLHKNITITKVIGGIVRTRQVPILSQCSADLTSNKHCLPCRNWKRKKEELEEINIGHRVHLLPHGGVGKDLGGLLILMKVTMEINQVLIEQGDLLYKCLGTSLQGMIFLNSFTLLQMDPLQLTAVCCNRRGV